MRHVTRIMGLPPATAAVCLAFAGPRRAIRRRRRSSCSSPAAATAATAPRRPRAKLVAPFGVDFDRAGNMYIVEMTGERRAARSTAKGVLTTLAGTGKKGDGGDGGPAAKAAVQRHAQPGRRARTATSTSPTPGTTASARSTPRPASSPRVRRHRREGLRRRRRAGGPGAVRRHLLRRRSTRKASSLYLADLDNRRIRAVDLKTGIVTTVAGNGEKGVPEDGADAARRRRWSIRGPWRRTPRATSTSWSAAATPCASSIRDGKIRTVAGTGQGGRAAATAAMPARRRSTAPSTCASTGTATSSSPTPRTT